MFWSSVCSLHSDWAENGFLLSTWQDVQTVTKVALERIRLCKTYLNWVSAWFNELYNYICFVKLFSSMHVVYISTEHRLDSSQLEPVLNAVFVYLFFIHCSCRKTHIAVFGTGLLLSWVWQQTASNKNPLNVHIQYWLHIFIFKQVYAFFSDNSDWGMVSQIIPADQSL